MPSLIELSQEERDALLSTIVFTDEPKFTEFEFWLEQDDDHSVNKVINYSQVMAEIDEKDTRCPPPSSLRNGDVLRFGDHRGIGTVYALWLKKGIFTYTPENLQYLKQSILDGGPGPAEKKARKDTEDEGVTVSSPNKDELDCYLFSHPDEWGYMPPPIASSQRPDLYEGVLDSYEDMMYFDPLLTVSTSYYGAMFVEAKKSDEWKDNENFPFQYIGLFDGNMVEWIPIEESNSHEISRGYFQALRSLFDKHFF